MLTYLHLTFNNSDRFTQGGYATSKRTKEKHQGRYWWKRHTGTNTRHLRKHVQYNVMRLTMVLLILCVPPSASIIRQRTLTVKKQKGVTKRWNICISLAEVQENEINEATYKYFNMKLSSEDAVSVSLISKSSDTSYSEWNSKSLFKLEA